MANSKFDDAGPLIKDQDVSRKLIERDWYDKVYRDEGEFSSLELREGILFESESYFRERLGFLARPGKKVLEIGCGEGRHAILAALCGAEVVGIDISTEGLARARANAEQAGVQDQIDFRLGDVEKLDFATAEFDLVIDHETLSSVYPVRVIEEVYRVLKPGGVFLGIECFGHNFIFNLNRTLKRLLGKRTSWAARHILRRNDVLQITSLFSHFSRKNFHLINVLLAPLTLVLPKQCGGYFNRLLTMLDGWFLNKCGYGDWSFKIVFESIKN